MTNREDHIKALKAMVRLGLTPGEGDWLIAELEAAWKREAKLIGVLEYIAEDRLTLKTEPAYWVDDYRGWVQTALSALPEHDKSKEKK